MKAKGGERKREPYKDSYGVDTDGRAMVLGERRNIHVQSEYIREGANGTRGGRETRRRAASAWLGSSRMLPRPCFWEIGGRFSGNSLQANQGHSKGGIEKSLIS